MIYLDHALIDPDGNDVECAIAHLKNKSYQSLKASTSWDYGASGEVTFWCKWEDLDRFIETVLGRNAVETISGNKRFVRTLPHKYPAFFFRNMWASKIVDITGIPGEQTIDSEPVEYPRIAEGGQVEYYYAEVVVEYEPVAWPMLEDSEVAYNEEWKRFTTIQKTPRLDYNTFAVGTFRFISDQGAVPHGLPLREESVDYLVTFHRCPEAFFNPGDFIGKANDADGFLAGHPQVPTAGFLKNTMQLIGMGEIIKPVAFTEDVYYEYQYFFQYRPNGFNKIRRNVGNTTFNYEEFSLDGATPVDNSTRAVALDDLTQLFQPNA